MRNKTYNFLKSFQRKFGKDSKFEEDKKAYKYLQSCENILDIGCGIGRFIEQDPEKTVGIDSNKETVNFCKNRGFKVFLAQATKLPFNDDSFEGIHCSHIIEHLPPNEAYNLLVEIDRVLKKKGIVCIRTPVMNKRFYDDFTHIKPYNPEAILHYLSGGKILQKTKEDIKGKYQVIKLMYNRDQFFLDSRRFPLVTLKIIFSILSRFGINNPRRTGYLMVLKKIG
jgi:ubiquinone/menaquinone biosynthesis C-methylase UbiE